MTSLRRATLAPLLFVCVASFAACDDPSTPFDSASRIVHVRVDSSAGPIVRTVEVKLAEPGAITLTYGAIDVPVLAITLDSAKADYRVTLPRLRADKTYRVQAVTLPSRTRPIGHVMDATFTTGPLPSDVAPITFTVSGTPTRPVALVEIVGGS